MTIQPDCVATRIAKGDSLVDAFRLGAAAGAAALINEGTELCPAAEAYRLSAQVGPRLGAAEDLGRSLLERLA